MLDVRVMEMLGLSGDSREPMPEESAREEMEEENVI